MVGTQNMIKPILSIDDSGEAMRHKNACVSTIGKCISCIRIERNTRIGGELLWVRMTGTEIE